MGFTESFFLLLSLLSMCSTSIEAKVCKGDVSVDSSNIDSFKDCTEITGMLVIDNDTFTGNETNPGIDPSELEVFSTLRGVEALYILSASHPNFTDLHYFRNLEVIGRWDMPFSLSIQNTSLKSFGFQSLRIILKVVSIENNVNLCFADGINWRMLIRSYLGFYLVPYLRNNRPKNDCVAENMVCHKLCSMAGCWGPSIDECVSCTITSPENTCLDSCSYPGMYQLDRQTCGKCHESCNETCTGRYPDNCVKCIKDGPYCVSECPLMKYEMNDECLPCNEKCAPLGCTGPAEFLGPGGCGTCDKTFFYSDNPNETCEDMCNTGNYFDYTTNMCLMCSFECNECWGPGWDQCKTCFMLKVPLGDNITNEFNCSYECPDDKPHIVEDQDGPYCSAANLVEMKGTNVPAIVGGVLGCTFVIGILVFVAVVVYQMRRRAKSRENTVMPMIMSGLENSEPLKL